MKLQYAIENAGFKKYVALLAVTLFSAVSITAQTTAFNYQGRLTESGSPGNGTYDMQFKLFDALSGGTQVGATISIPSVSVTAGTFDVQLDFGGNAFTGANRFLEVAVRRNAAEQFVVLAPRMQILTSPHSIRSISASAADTATNVSGVVQIANGGTGSSAQNFVDLSTNQANIGGDKTFTGVVSVTGAGGTFAGNGSGLTNLNGANITNGSISASQLAAEALPNSSALKLLGSLRWDLLKVQTNFSVGTSPAAAAFDGVNIWVVNSGSNTVTKLRASDGANLGTFPVGSNPKGIAFDGANMWVTNSGSGNVTKLRVSDGANVGTFTVGGTPTAIAFDGANLWMITIPGGATNGTVIRLRASDGVNLGSLTVGPAARGVAFDGTNIWVTSAQGTIKRFRASDGADVGNAFGSSGAGIAFDGVNMWVSSSTNNNVTKLRVSDGANLGTFSVGTSPIAVAFDGANIWVTNTGGNSVTKLRASDGTNLGTFPVGTNPQAIAFDGANMWVTNTGDAIVTRMQPAFPQ